MAGIVILTDVIAPDSIWVAGVTGKQKRRNRRGENIAGFKRINVLWSNTLRQYEFGTAPQTVAGWRAIEGLHEVTDGGAYGFLIKDPKDNRCELTESIVTLIDAPSHTYQLKKRYTSVGSAQYRDRTIRHVDASGFVLAISGTPTMSYTLAANTGVVTIASDPDPAVVTWSAPIYVPVHFTSDDIDWELVVAGISERRRMAGRSILLEEVRE